MPLRALVLLQSDGDEMADGSLTASDWIAAGVVLLAGCVLAVLVGRILRALIGRAFPVGFVAILVSRVIAGTVLALTLFYALGELGVAVGPLLGALGLSGLVIALALQSVVENLVAGVLLQVRRPFDVGETVRLDDRVGEVVDVDTRTVLLRTLDGTQLRIPNSTVFSSEIENLTRDPVRRSRLIVGVRYGSDLDVAVAEALAAANEVDAVVSEPAPQVFLREFGSSSIDLDVFYWHAGGVPAEYEARHELVRGIDRRFAEAGIEIPFPQLTVWPGEV
ncbi:MAG: mechanosensitive ion channel family protein [Actinomycetota bacterium]